MLTLSGGMFGLQGGKQVLVVCKQAVQSIWLAKVWGWDYNINASLQNKYSEINKKRKITHSLDKHLVL